MTILTNVVENGIASELGQVVSEKRSLDGGISNMDILQSEIGERLLPPRNAWVQCDDCLKWRRIPSLLADQIEETNCRWYVIYAHIVSRSQMCQ